MIVMLILLWYLRWIIIIDAFKYNRKPVRHWSKQYIVTLSYLNVYLCFIIQNTLYLCTLTFEYDLRMGWQLPPTANSIFQSKQNVSLGLVKILCKMQHFHLWFHLFLLPIFPLFFKLFYFFFSLLFGCLIFLFSLIHNWNGNYGFATVPGQSQRTNQYKFASQQNRCHWFILLVIIIWMIFCMACEILEGFLTVFIPCVWGFIKEHML